MHETCSKGELPKIILPGRVSNELLKSINLVVCRFSDNLLALIHWVTFINSLFIVLKKDIGVWMGEKLVIGK